MPAESQTPCPPARKQTSKRLIQYVCLGAEVTCSKRECRSQCTSSASAAQVSQQTSGCAGPLLFCPVSCCVASHLLSATQKVVGKCGQVCFVCRSPLQGEQVQGPWSCGAAISSSSAQASQHAFRMYRAVAVPSCQLVCRVTPAFSNPVTRWGLLSRHLGACRSQSQQAGRPCHARAAAQMHTGFC